MSLENAKNLFNNGNLNEALKELSNYDQSDEWLAIEAVLVRSKILFHKGKLDDALFELDAIEEIASKFKDFYPNFSCFKSYILANQGNYNDLIDDDASLDERNYYSRMISGMIKNREGKYKEGISIFISALELAENNLDKAITHYHLGMMYSRIGLIESANYHLGNNLNLLLNSELKQNQAVSMTLIGQNQLLAGKFHESSKSLLDAVKVWEDLNSPHGLSWALGELAVLYISNGFKSEGVDYLVELYEIIKDNAPPSSLSSHLVNIIKYSLDLDQRDQAIHFLDEFEKLVHRNSSDLTVKARYIFADSITKGKSKRISEALSVISKFEQLNSYQEYSIQLESFIRQSQLMLLEFQITEDELTKKELISEIGERHKILLNYLQKNQNIGIVLLASEFQISFLKLNESPEQVLDNILNDQSLVSSKLGSDQNTSEEAWRIPDLDKDLHSIPKLKIMLYLLPRISVSFSDLQNKTELSSGNLTGQCQKLEEIGYIERFKIFSNTKPITMFRLTPLGFQQFRNYANSITQYLLGIL